MATRPGDEKVARSPHQKGDGITTSLDSLHSLASSLAARWHELEDAGRLALVEEIRRSAQALRQQARRDREDLGLDEESLEDSLIHEPLALLTPRELEVLQAIADGETTRVIAAHLGITPLTVRSHVKSLLGKLGVHSRLEAASVFLRLARRLEEATDDSPEALHAKQQSLSLSS